MKKIAYFVHDLTDAAVGRRVRMLITGGASVVLIGFRRSAAPADIVDGVQVVDLGRTRDGQLGARVIAVAGVLSRIEGIGEVLGDADVIIARNLEMLVIAMRARKRSAPRARLIYECLDIHRLLLSPQPHCALLRRLESRLWRDVDLLLTSSPAFVQNYFAPRRFPGPVKLLENKVLLMEEPPDLDPKAHARIRVGPPWRIGWFGMLRCRKSLDILGSLARKANGAVEIVIRGRPSDATLTDLASRVSPLPHVHFAGAYSSHDLSTIYGDVHFSWAIDYYEEGQNSDWLLPNRMYESALFGAVPIALSKVATGRWLAKRGVGVLLDGPIESATSDFVGRLNSNHYMKLAQQLRTLPRRDLVAAGSDCRELVEAL